MNQIEQILAGVKLDNSELEEILTAQFERSFKELNQELAKLGSESEKIKIDRETDKETEALEEQVREVGRRNGRQLRESLQGRQSRFPDSHEGFTDILTDKYRPDNNYEFENREAHPSEMSEAELIYEIRELQPLSEAAKRVTKLAESRTMSSLDGLTFKEKLPRLSESNDKKSFRGDRRLSLLEDALHKRNFRKNEASAEFPATSEEFCKTLRG